MKKLIHMVSPSAIGTILPEECYPICGTIKVMNDNNEFKSKIRICRSDEVINCCFDTDILESICTMTKVDNNKIVMSVKSGEIPQYYDYIVNSNIYYNGSKYELDLSGKCRLNSDFSITMNHYESIVEANLTPVYHEDKFYDIKLKLYEGR